MSAATLPEGLAARPQDPRGWPIPYCQLIVDGRVDYTTLDALKVAQVAAEYRCGLCGAPLRGHAAFVGGPLSGSSLVYGDPAMHVACAEYALRTCPHLAYQRAVRRDEGAGTFAPGSLVDKPAYWVMTIAAGYHLIRQGEHLYFKADAPARQRTYRYRADGRLWPDA